MEIHYGTTKVCMHQVREELQRDKMENVFIKTEQYALLKKFFKNQDLISIEDLIALIDDLSYDLDRMNEEYKDLLQDMQDNYKFIGTREAIGYDERTW